MRTLQRRNRDIIVNRTGTQDTHYKEKTTGSSSWETKLTQVRAWVPEMGGNLVKTYHMLDFQARLISEVVFQ